MRNICATGQEHLDARKDLNETNDCTVRAVATVCDVDYATAHAACAKRGRKNRKGAQDHQYMGAVLDLGYHYRDVTGLMQECKTVRRFGEYAKPGAKYVVIVERHAMGWDGEKFVDWADGRLHRVKTVYQVAKTQRELPPETPRVYETHDSPLCDIVFIHHRPDRNEWRIYQRINGKVKWTNSKHSEHAADYAASMVEYTKGPRYVGEFDPKSEELKEFTNEWYWETRRRY